MKVFINKLGVTSYIAPTFVSSVHRVFSQTSSSRCLLAKPTQAFMWFWCWNYNAGHFYPLAFFGGLMNPNQQYFGCCCGVFYAISKESSLCSQSNFGHLTPPGRAGHRSMFSPFVVKGSHCGSLKSQSVTTVSRLGVFWSTSLCQAGPFKVMS